MTSNMFMRKRSFLEVLRTGLAILGFLVGGESLAQVSAPEFEYNLIYGRVSEGPLRLDLMVPTAGEGPYPVVIVIHGGAWQRGDKVEGRAIMARLADRGYASVSPQYRFAPENPFPAALHDLKEVVRWVKANAKTQLLDPNRIGVYGQTAGAHLALMLGVTTAEDGLEGPKADNAPQLDTRVQAVVSFFGPTDLAADDFSPLSKQLITDFLGAPPSETPELARKASPLTYVSKNDPPILMFHNPRNVDIPVTQAEKLKKAMEKAGVPGRLEIIPDFNQSPRQREEEKANKIALEFFDTYLKAK